MKCQGCYSEISDSAIFCPYCGKKKELAPEVKTNESQFQNIDESQYIKDTDIQTFNKKRQNPGCTFFFIGTFFTMVMLIATTWGKSEYQAMSALGLVGVLYIVMLVLSIVVFLIFRKR